MSLFKKIILTIAIISTITILSLSVAQTADGETKPLLSSNTTTTTNPVPATIVVNGKSYDSKKVELFAAAYKKHLLAEQWRKIVALDKAYKAHLLWSNIAKLTAWYKAQQAKAYPHGLCGGDLPPCYVMMRESRGDIHAQNPRSTASGKWQFLDSTWGGYGGYAKARYAPEKVQDDRARQLWAGGRGCGHWSAC